MSAKTIIAYAVLYAITTTFWSFHCHQPPDRHRVPLKSDADDALGLCLLLRLDITLRMDSKLMDEEPLLGFLGLWPTFGLSVGVKTWAGAAEEGPATVSCLELLARRRNCTVIRTLSTACTQPNHSVQAIQELMCFRHPTKSAWGSSIKLDIPVPNLDITP